ncbi:MAG: Rpn family recombination-promoting nuclease/putative transposase [Spirochaetes bacterium]|nr:Rpn family recombination-promoting nuclease/putative transposase [Spirochaetota bacterium]
MADGKIRHDNAYKRIFEHPELVQQLLVYFSGEEFVKELDCNSLTKIDKSFVTVEFVDRESDIIYKVKCLEKEIYIYLLMEFQSSVDRFMSQRILRYILELYDFLLRSDKIKTLPAVFPVLLYNGDADWTAPEDIFDLIVKGVIPDMYIPHFKYCKITINDLSNEFILNVKNFVSALFYAENSNKYNLLSEFNVIAEMLRKEKPEFIKLFSNWLKYIFKVDNEEFINDIESIPEVKKMGLAEKVDRWREEIFLEGKAEGKAEAEQEIIDKAVKKMLMRGMTIDEIIDITDLDFEYIEKLRGN